MTRAKKGTIVIDNRNGFLRLRLPRHFFNGEQKYLSLGLPDTTENRKIALAKASIMQSDYIYERFDFSLEKYKFNTAPPPIDNYFDLIAIYEKYIAFKQNHLTKGSMKNYVSVKAKLLQMPSAILAKASNIKMWLLENTTQEQARRTLTNLSACMDWAVENEIIFDNPFTKLKKIKAVKNEEIDPFSREERDFIIDCFNQSRYFDYYVNFVKFLLFTGCRPSEAIALEWNNIDSQYIVFKEAIVEGEYQPYTKTKKVRKFPINEQLAQILDNIYQESKYVFLAKEGGVIDMHNFTTRAWTHTLNENKVRYRPPYNCRHTFITLCLDAGVPIQQVAAWVGNSPAIILNHYAGLTRNTVPLI
jgi:integrase